jgi:hypothetical protein
MNTKSKMVLGVVAGAANGPLTTIRSRSGMPW